LVVKRFAAVVALVIVSASGGAAARTAAVPGWLRVEPGGKTACARGGEYAFWTRVRDPKRLVLFYSLRVRGVALRDWGARLAAGRNVSCPTSR
jgi:hypothetical protein